MNLPCPFCGGEPTACSLTSTTENIARIFCKKCKTIGPEAWSFTEAWTLWNHRVLGREEFVSTIPSPPMDGIK